MPDGVGSRRLRLWRRRTPDVSHVSHREARELHEVRRKETEMRITASVVAACALLAVSCNRGESRADAHDQANTPPAERPASEPRRDNAAHPTMHVTGCIEPGVIAGTFMLTQVDVGGTEASTEAGAGTTSLGSPATSGHADDRAMPAERADAHTA